ncbi:helix-turn-helix transcriptional regulator [Actinomadura sp. 6K520]|uniref:helix-turn-helix domain-containing protein n=1 Tax=Actinomadura sp. 6K520 TaxID=2530364 RepID=UPI001A9DD6C7|nr:helix-turn-helix transcriptional regulator [Actinomadura sp. 6K520]
MTQVHSVLLRAGEERCATAARPPAAALRPYVAGYGDFRTGTPGVVRRRVLPLNLVTLLVDLDGPGPLAFGARGAPMVYGEAGWRRGVTVGLTVAGARALLGTPMCLLTGTAVELADVLGRRAGELAERLAAAPDPPARFAVLDDLLTRWLCPGKGPDGPAMLGWWRLQEAAGGISVGDLAAEIGVSRRRLETGFRREIGLSPKTVARVARFQRAAQVLGTSGAFRAAVACGYADQPHFNREVRAMTGVTPTELCALLQYTGRPTG